MLPGSTALEVRMDWRAVNFPYPILARADCRWFQLSWEAGLDATIDHWWPYAIESYDA